MDTYEVLQQALSAFPELSILAIAQEHRSLFGAHTGRLVCIGRSFPEAVQACTDFTYRRAADQDGVDHALSGLRRALLDDPFDVIYIDHDHRLEAVLDQIQAILPMTHEHTLFVFDGALPPELGMAGPAPSQAWWVGEVWMLGALPLTVGGPGQTFLIDLPPTGMLVSSGVTTLSRQRFADQYDGLALTLTIEQLRSHLAPLRAADPQAALIAALACARRHRTKALSVASTSELARRSQIIDPARPWHRPSPAFVMDLSGRKLDLTDLKARHGMIHAKHIETFDDVYLTGLDSFITQGTFYSRLIDGGDVALNLVREAEYSRTPLRLDGDTLCIPRTTLREAVSLEGQYFFGTPDEPDNWGMWLLYGIPSADHFLSHRAQFDGYLTCLHHPWQRALLSALGLNERDLVPHVLARTYHCPSVTLIRHSARDLTLSADDARIFRRVGDELAARSTVAVGERIYISRLAQAQRHPQYRVLLNEQELILRLMQLGFAIVEPERLMLEAQVRVFRNAQVVVGLGGAGMFNAIFCRPDTLIIDIESSMDFTASHLNLFLCNGLRCGLVLGRQDLSDPEPVHKRWVVNVDAVAAKVAEFV